MSSVVGAPVAVVAGHEAAGDEQDEVDEPPDAQPAQREQLPHGGARVAQAEAVDPETAQEEGVEQRGDEVVSRVSAQNNTTAGVPPESHSQDDKMNKLQQRKNICNANVRTVTKSQTSRSRNNISARHKVRMYFCAASQPFVQAAFNKCGVEAVWTRHADRHTEDAVNIKYSACLIAL